VSFYEQYPAQLLPIAGKSHSIFSLRNIIHVIQSILPCPPEELTGMPSVVSGWYHELTREFRYHFKSEQDRAWFVSVMESRLKHEFHVEDKAACESAVCENSTINCWIQNKILGNR
jgi:hypothetical protein